MSCFARKWTSQCWTIDLMTSPRHHLCTTWQQVRGESELSRRETRHDRREPVAAENRAQDRGSESILRHETNMRIIMRELLYNQTKIKVKIPKKLKQLIEWFRKNWKAIKAINVKNRWSSQMCEISFTKEHWRCYWRSQFSNGEWLRRHCAICRRTRMTSPITNQN